MRAQNQLVAKLNNKNVITELLIRKAPISRIELSKITGLSKMTVTNIVNELADEGIIKTLGAEDTALGRKPIALAIKPESRNFLGIYISRNHINAMSGDLSGKLNVHKRIRTPHSADELIKSIFLMIDELVSNTKNISGIGVSSIGPVDYKKGVILNPPNFHGIKNLAIKELLEKRYNLPVYLDKDTNASALAEWLFGKARDVSDYVYLGVTKGIGAAVISEDTLYRGANGFGGEIGHITVDLNGKRCSCGNIGCLEMYASIDDDENTDIRQKCRYLAAGVTALINLFDPSVIYLGHEIAKYGDDVAKMLQEEINSRYLTSDIKKIGVEISAFGEKAPVYGAFSLAVCGYIGKI